MEKQNKDLRLNYNVMDANQSFFYVILINILAPLAFAILIVGLKILSNLGLPQEVYNMIYGLFSVVVIPCAFLILIILMHRKRNIDLQHATNFDVKIKPIILVICIAILGLTIVAFFPLINMIYSLLGSWGLRVEGDVAFAMNNWWQFIIGIVVYCALPAIAEEIIFRGMIFRGTLSKAKPIVAITISSLAFFIMHGSLIQSFYQIALGFLLGIIAYYTKNILYPIAFHFLNNLCVISFNYFGVGGFLNGFALNFGGFMTAIGIMVGCVAVIFGLILLLKHLTKSNVEGYEFVVENNNIIVEEKPQKLGLKEFINSFNIDEKFYFVSAWVIAIIIWLLGSL